MRHKWTKVDTVWAVAAAVIIGIPALLVGLTDMETGMAILNVLVKILEVTLVVAAILAGIFLGLKTVNHVKKKSSSSGISEENADGFVDETESMKKE